MQICKASTGFLVVLMEDLSAAWLHQGSKELAVMPPPRTGPEASGGGIERERERERNQPFIFIFLLEPLSGASRATEQT